MYVITIADIIAGRVTAHPYLPVAPVNAQSVARELSRDFPQSVVTVRSLFNGKIAWQYQQGAATR